MYADPLKLIAETLGANALAAYIVALCVLLALAGAVGWLAGRLLRRDDGDGPLPLAQVVVRLAAGFAIIVGAAAGFAELAEELGEGEEIARFDELLVDAIRREVATGTLQAFALLTRLGDTLTLTVLCVVVAAWLVMRGRRALAFGWVVALAGNGALNQTLKYVFERVRPLHEHGLVHAQGWSFPSGHSSGSVVAYGMLAYLLVRSVAPRWRMPVVVLGAAIAFTVGISRMLLQVHFASDVIAGFMSGLSWLAVCIVSIESARGYRRRRRMNA